MKILVTGATGFAGGYMLEYLKEKYPDVYLAGTGRNVGKAEELRSQGYNMITGALTDPEFIKDKLGEFTHVIHSAARSSIWGKYDDFFRDNVLVTTNLLDNIEHLERFVYISTANIYFNFKDRVGVKEDDVLPKNYVSYYPVTKLIGEKEVLNYNSRPVHTISLRPRGIIGRGDTTSMPRILKAYEEDKIKIIGKGDNVIDFTSVKNLAHAVYLSLTSGKETSGQAYNISDDETFGFWSLMDETTKRMGYDKKIGKIPYPIVYFAASLSELIAKIRGGYEPSLTRYAAGVMKASFTLNNDKARQQLGYKPIIRSLDSLNEFLEWYKTS
jgi:nucleoside-diphosphate-sugar epimerase